MVRRFAKVSEEIEKAFVLSQFKLFCPSSKTNCSKVKIELQHIHHYSPPLRGIVVYHYCFRFLQQTQ